MKPTFHHKAVNGPFGDPALYLRLLREKRALLFDAGDLTALTSGEMHKISDLFVTHTHIDHFLGFDRLLRASLRRENPLRLYGPEGFLQCVEGRLGGYTWDLIDEYPVVLTAHEVSEGGVTIAEYSAKNAFQRADRGALKETEVIYSDPLLSVRAASLSHGIPVLAYSVEEKLHINIDKSRLEERGFSTGPWLNSLKEALREERYGDTILVEGRELRVEDLRDLARFTRGQKVSYVVDISPTRSNIEKATELVKGSDTLYIETYFLDKDIDRAIDRNHLTARMAGEIAGEAGVRNVIPMHISPKYRSSPEKIEEELIRASGKGSS